MTEVPYFDELIRIRGWLESQYESFPQNKCQLATKHIITEIPELEELAGYFQETSQKEKGFESQQHAWAYDRANKLYIDTTLDQLGKYDPVTILPQSAPLLTPCPILTKRQKEITLEQLLKFHRNTK